MPSDSSGRNPSAPLRSLLGAILRTWGLLGHSLQRLAAFLVALGWFVVHLGADFARPERVFQASGASFGAPRAMFFQVCSCTHTCNANTAREAFCIGKTNTKRMSATLLVSHKAKKNRSYGYLKRTPGQSSLRI